MAWKVRFTKLALKQLKKLDKQIADQITRTLQERVAESHDPRAFGKALIGELKGFWRYRIGDYRVVCELKDTELLILALAIGHRREIHK